MPAEAACLLSVIGNGIRWVKTRGELAFGETVAVPGPGPQGLATVIAAREAGAERIIVLGLRRDRMRLDLAREFGATQTVTIVNVVPAVDAGPLAATEVGLTGSTAVGGKRMTCKYYCGGGRGVMGGAALPC